MTARHLARHPVRHPVTVLSPYTGRLLRVVAAREVGCHVVLETEDGRDVIVDAAQKVRES